MRALGQKLGVDPMAVYRHFRDKEALLEALVEAALAVVRLPAADDGSAAERLRGLLVELRAGLAAHPGVASRVASTQPNLGPHTVALTGACFGLIRELGLDDSEATRALVMVIRYVAGVVVAEERAQAGGASEADWREQLQDAYASVSPIEFPQIATMATQLGQLSFDADFEYGLDLILEGLVRRGRGTTDTAQAPSRTAST
jgi:AcrR family transcriptional regulator